MTPYSLPTFSPRHRFSDWPNADHLPKFADGVMTLDRLTKAYVRERLEYQYAILASSSEAFALEKQCREGMVFGAKPLLNPA